MYSTLLFTLISLPTLISTSPVIITLPNSSPPSGISPPKITVYPGADCSHGPNDALTTTQSGAFNAAGSTSYQSWSAATFTGYNVTFFTDDGCTQSIGEQVDWSLKPANDLGDQFCLNMQFAARCVMIVPRE